MLDLVFAFGIGVSANYSFQYEKEIGVIEVSQEVGDWEIKYHHDSSLANGLRRDSSDNNVLYVIRKFK